MLKQRVLTALPLAAGFIAAILWLPGAWLAGLFAAVVLLGGHEWARLAGLRGAAGWIYALAVAALALLIWRFGAAGELVWVALGGVWWLLIQGWMMLTGVSELRGRSVGWLAGGLITLVLCYLALMGIAALDSRLLLFSLLIVWSADIGAYFSGRRWGRRKLAPETSPGKSWEGVAGGLLAVGLVAALAAVALEIANLVGFVLAAVVAGAFSVTGDLLESRLKRAAGAKDSGQLLPGHGGVLDRIDSITAAAPVFWCGLVLTG